MINQMIVGHYIYQLSLVINKSISFPGVLLDISLR